MAQPKSLRAQMANRAEENLALEQARNEDDDLIKLLKQNIEEAKVRIKQLEDGV